MSFWTRSRARFLLAFWPRSFSPVSRKAAPIRTGKFITWFRDVLVGRDCDEHPWLRSVESMSPRSPPPANLPDGPAHKLAANYYYTRDLRRDMAPPLVVSSYRNLPHTQQLMESKDMPPPAVVMDAPPVPGRLPPQELMEQTK
ncbi:NADH dehydrogenase [ubiquinone] 1 alpha subcomplex subunit 7-like [Dysidea avara]|uniref:NADH dehydrogenase [ubiquinone] 1 alpha subcomplex subunit 7-like n=1 Tax=Dysidea avara TaxID=196820 RepID=UPI00332EDAA3